MGRARRILLLGILYLAQGMPFGFQANALPAYLRESGLSLTAIGLAGALALPWMLKPLWAPIVDRWFERRWWIVGLSLAMTLTAFAAAWIPPNDLYLLGVAIFGMNVLAATQDIAVDGLAVDILATDELGPGNAAQVVGYKLGMVLGGGVLVALAGDLRWRGVFLGMSALLFVAFLVALTIPRDRRPDRSVATVREVVARLLLAMRLRGAGWLLLVVATYKLGETLIDAMYKPFLVDTGYSAASIGLFVGTYGMIASIVGSIAGGVLARHLRILHAVAVASVLRIFPLVGEWLLTLVAPTDPIVGAVTAAEHFFGGMLTTTMFALMMSRVDRRIAATHFTLLAAVEVWGKLPVGSAAGALADRIGYPSLFLAGVLLSIAFLGLLVPLARAERTA